MLRHLVLFIVLLAFWAVLSGQLDWSDSHQRYLMICGLASCALAIVIVKRVGFLDKEGPLGRFLVGAIIYVPWLLWQIVKSNIDVARRIWSLKPDLDPVVYRAPYDMKSSLGAAVYANSITLTPGTLTIEIDTEKQELTIHALHPSNQDTKSMHDRVLALEGKQ